MPPSTEGVIQPSTILKPCSIINIFLKLFLKLTEVILNGLFYDDFFLIRHGIQRATKKFAMGGGGLHLQILLPTITGVNIVIPLFSLPRPSFPFFLPLKYFFKAITFLVCWWGFMPLVRNDIFSCRLFCKFGHPVGGSWSNLSEGSLHTEIIKNKGSMP